MKMSPREAFALRDYLGADLKGRAISDARQVVSLTDISATTLVIGQILTILDIEQPASLVPVTLYIVVSGGHAFGFAMPVSLI